MACTNCLDGCNGAITPDVCVRYTGPDVSSLEISTGDSLYTVDAAIIEKLLSFTDGSGITLSDIQITCQFLVNYLQGKEQTLSNLTQMLSDAVCFLADELQALSEQVNTPTVFDTDCLEDLPSEPTRDDILQAVVTKVCSIDASLTIINNDYVKNSQLCSLVTACIAANTSNQEYLKMPKYCPIPYVGPLSVFDSAGKGLAAQGYDKVYLCIGQTINGFSLPDSRGRSPIGVNTNVPTSGMDNNVNPALPANAAYGIANKGKLGNYTNTLTVSQLSPHNHTVNDSGHTHTFNAFNPDNSVGGTGDGVHWKIGGSTPTSSSTTGITINSTGGGQPHNNTHPVFGCYFIIYIP